jgi:hypothetical protein
MLGRAALLSAASAGSIDPVAAETGFAVRRTAVCAPAGRGAGDAAASATKTEVAPETEPSARRSATASHVTSLAQAAALRVAAATQHGATAAAERAAL